MDLTAIDPNRRDAQHDVQDTRAAWDQIAPGYDETVTPTHLNLGGRGLARAGLRAGMRFLDVAAGSGALSIPAARLGAQVLATDQSPVMLARLAQRARQEGLSIETAVMDGQALDLDDNSFDLVGSQFGVMLFPDMPRGVREMARVAKPGARVLMTTLGDPRQVEFFAFFLRAIQSVRPDFAGPPMDPPPLPFQLRDPLRLRAELTAAGLHEVAVEMMTEAIEVGSGTELWNWLVRSNPVAEGVLISADLTNSQREAVRAVLERMVRERAGGAGIARLTSPINVGIGTK
jgi:ubiquinone/menaquinone biosynthesis C-methylase UbiE